MDWDKSFSYALGAIDNAIEHIIIVPNELKLHLERRKHWEAVMFNAFANLHTLPEVERCFAVCLHWAFMSQVLSETSNFQTLKNFAKDYELVEIAENFSDQFLSLSKEEKISMLFSSFPEILSKDRAGLEYINNVTGSRQHLISP